MAKRRALRIPAGLPGAGRFTSAPALVKLAHAVSDDGRLVIVDALGEAADRQARAAAQALRALERAARRFDDDPKRFARSRAVAEARWQHAQAQTDFLVASAEQILAPMVEEIVIVRPRRPAEPPPEDESVEWELGMVYQAAAGRDKDFDMNVRVRRFDSRPMRRAEAERVLVLFREALDRYNPMMPPGYVLAAINWRRPSWGSSWSSSLTHIAEHLHAFLNPLYVKADVPDVWSAMPVRLGSVK